MRNAIIAGAVIVAVLVYYVGGDSFPKTILYDGVEFKLGTSSGDKELMKTYQYTQSGNINGLNDYVQVFVIPKTAQAESLLQKTREMNRRAYKVEELPSGDGKFGVFRTPSEQREYFAYSIEREDASSFWVLNFVVQSNYAQVIVTSPQARVFKILCQLKITDALRFSATNLTR
jgi:hypothetical protein